MCIGRVARRLWLTLAILGVGGLVLPLSAQQPACPRPALWPLLPSPEELPAQPAYLVAGQDSAGQSVLRPPQPDTNMTVPQYAYFRAERGAECIPVIIIQAEAGALGYRTLKGDREGAAARSRFTLLGTKEPELP